MKISSEVAQDRRARSTSIQNISHNAISLEPKNAFSSLRSILLYGCETWPVRVTDERMSEVFDNDSIRRILHVRHRGCVPPAELRRRLCLTSISFGHAASRPEDELIKDLLLPKPPRTWRRRTGGQLKTCAITIKADLEPLAGP